ncbi:MAG: dimethyl sulfoxide reductase anchor subunit [Desulfosarcina sp.]|nr:dimethyl sulfoxide reductase anchor subunit [Desulfosarcina sp.]
MAYLEIVPPLRQRSWGWPAVVNLTLGGTGSGLYLLGAFFTILSQKWPADVQFISFQVLAPVVVCFGFLSLSMEAGKPLRAYRLFSNLSNSWMSIESLAGAIFIIIAFISHFYSSFVFTAIAVVAALVLIISQGFMVFRATAVKAWNEWLVPVLFVTSGFMTACGLFLLNTQSHSRMTKLPVVIFLICTFFSLVVWLLYLFGRRGNDFKKAVNFLRRPVSLLLIVGIGHIIPLFLLFSIFLSTDVENASLLSAVLRLVSGLMLIVGGASQKVGIILAAGYYRGIVFESTKES